MISNHHLFIIPNLPVISPKTTVFSLSSLRPSRLRGSLKNILGNPTDPIHFPTPSAIQVDAD